jgi:sensor domain CHASE-containing protein
VPERKKTKSASSHVLVQSVLIFAVGLLALWLVSSWYSKQLLDDQRIKVHERIMPYANALSDSISKRLGLLDSQEAFITVSFNEVDFLKKFKAFASGIFAANPGIRALEVFPPSGSEIIFPQAGNEAVAYGSLDNLLNDPRPAVRADVAKTIQSKKIILSEPYQLLQGGLGLVARKAIYIQGKFWGLTALVLDLPSLLGKAGLRFSEMKDLDIALSDSNGTVFEGKQEVF